MFEKDLMVCLYNAFQDLEPEIVSNIARFKVQRGLMLQQETEILEDTLAIISVHSNADHQLVVGGDLIRFIDFFQTIFIVDFFKHYVDQL